MELCADDKAFLDDWDHRLTFGAGYFDTVELVCKAATVRQVEGNLRLAAAQLAETLEHARRALQTACAAIENFAQVPNRAAVAVMSEYVYRDLRRQVQRS